ncbi:MAG: transmembrane domain-containing protein [Luteolibacter sp.]
MKKAVVILIAAVLAGTIAFWLMRSHQISKNQGALLDSMPELAWVRTELKLSDEKFAEVSKLHSDYRPKCMEMCGKIAMAHEKMVALAGRNQEMSHELETAIREYAATRAECQQAMLNHIYQTAGVLDKYQAARYLETTLPYALDTSPGDSAHGHSH